MYGTEKYYKPTDTILTKWWIHKNNRYTLNGRIINSKCKYYIVGYEIYKYNINKLQKHYTLDDLCHESHTVY